MNKVLMTLAAVAALSACGREVVKESEMSDRGSRGVNVIVNSYASGGAGGSAVAAGGAGGSAVASGGSSNSSSSNSNVSNNTNSSNSQNSNQVSNSNSNSNSSSNQNNNANSNQNTNQVTSISMVQIDQDIELDYSWTFEVENGVEKPATLPAQKPVYTRGATCKLYDLSSTKPAKLPDFSTITPLANLQVSELNSTARDWQTPMSFLPSSLSNVREWFGLECEGFVRIQKAGLVEFTLTSDDNSELTIGSNVLISMDQLQSPSTKKASVNLKAGYTKFKIRYMQGPRTQTALVLSLGTSIAPLYRKQVN